jgi:hypothetical protein
MTTSPDPTELARQHAAEQLPISAVEDAGVRHYRALYDALKALPMREPDDDFALTLEQHVAASRASDLPPLLRVLGMLAMIALSGLLAATLLPLLPDVGAVFERVLAQAPWRVLAAVLAAALAVCLIDRAPRPQP